MIRKKRCYRANVNARLALENLEDRQLMAADLTPLADVQPAMPAPKVYEPASAIPAGFLGGHDPVAPRGKPVVSVASTQSLSPTTASRGEKFGDGVTPEPGIDRLPYADGDAPLPCGVVEEPTIGDAQDLDAIENDDGMRPLGVKRLAPDIASLQPQSGHYGLSKVVPLSDPLHGERPASQAAAANPRLAVLRPAVVDDVLAVAEEEAPQRSEQTAVQTRLAG